MAAGRITTGLWPGFPSDFVSLITVLATQAEGRTLVHDWMYELRLFALEQLSGMRADLFLCDPHRIIVTGPTQLYGRILDPRDLRSGMALIAAALAAEGESRLSPLETVERGYGQLVDRLKGAGGAGREDRRTSAFGAAAAPAARRRRHGAGGTGVAAAASRRTRPATGIGRRAAVRSSRRAQVARRPGTAAGRPRSGPARGRCAASASG